LSANALQVEIAALIAMRHKDMAQGHDAREETIIAFCASPRPQSCQTNRTILRATPSGALAAIAAALGTNHRCHLLLEGRRPRIRKPLSLRKRLCFARRELMHASPSILMY